MKLFKMHQPFLDGGDEERRFVVASYRKERFEAIAHHVNVKKKRPRLTYESLGFDADQADMYRKLNITPAQVRAQMEKKLNG